MLDDYGRDIFPKNQGVSSAMLSVQRVSYVGQRCRSGGKQVKEKLFLGQKKVRGQGELKQRSERTQIIPSLVNVIERLDSWTPMPVNRRTYMDQMHSRQATCHRSLIYVENERRNEAPFSWFLPNILCTYLIVNIYYSSHFSLG